MEKEKKLNVKFKDKENMLCKVEIEITERNGYPELSMCGECSGSMGQCGDNIKPADDKQKRLLEIWKTYHLNGMNSGTPKQEELLKNMKEEYEYDRARCFLDSYDKDGKPLTAYDLDELHKEKKKIQKKIEDMQSEIFILNEKQTQMKTDGMVGNCWVVVKDLDIKEFIDKSFGVKSFFDREISRRTKKLDDLNKILELENEKTMLYDYGTDGKLYSYGSTWHRVDLPKGLWKEVTELVKDINKIEELKKVKGGNWEDIDDYKIVALGKHLGLEPKEAEQDITGDDDLYSYCGVDYYVLTENEAYDRCEDYLGDELWQMAVENGNTEKGKAEWIEEVISMDGYGQILNGYDGTSEYDDENKVYIMRC